MDVSSEVEQKPRPARLPPALVALVVPDAGMERQARAGGVKLPLLIAMACALLAGGAAALRVDAAEATLKKLERAGSLQTMSERQIEDDTRTAERAFMLTRIAGAAVEAPVGLGLAALSLVILSWFFKGRMRGSAVLPVAAASLLPGAVANLLDGVAALRHATLPPERLPLVPRTLADLSSVLGHPLAGPLAKAGSAIDLFALWAALLLAYGLAAGSGMPPRRALCGTLGAWLCFRLLTHVAVGG